MKKKQLIVTSVLGALVASNVLTGYVFSKELDSQKYGYKQVIENLHSLNEQYEDKIKSQQVLTHELNEKVELRDNKIEDLQKQLKELKKKQNKRESP